MSKLSEYLCGREIYLDDEEIEAIECLCRKEREQSANVGYQVSRIEHNPREKAFHEEWMKENAPLSYINHGNGILQDLFIESKQPFNLGCDTTVIEIIQPRDRMIVATVIQWLGSNCGMSFLSEALKRFGARIHYKEMYSRDTMLYACRRAFQHQIESLPYDTTSFDEWEREYFDKKYPK